MTVIGDHRPEVSISLAELQSLAGLFMANDPSPLTPEEDSRIIIWLNQASREFGYDDWIEAYHDYKPTSLVEYLTEDRD